MPAVKKPFVSLPLFDRDYLACQVNRLSSDVYENNRLAKELIGVGDEQKKAAEDLIDKLDTLNDNVESLIEVIKTLIETVKNKDTE